MGDIVNLRDYRKKRDRKDKARQAAVNREKFGRTKTEVERNRRDRKADLQRPHHTLQRWPVVHRAGYRDRRQNHDQPLDPQGHGERVVHRREYEHRGDRRSRDINPRDPVRPANGAGLEDCRNRDRDQSCPPGRFAHQVHEIQARQATRRKIINTAGAFSKLRQVPLSPVIAAAG